MLKKIEMGKQYRTYDGRAVRVLAVDRRGSSPVVVLITEHDGAEYVAYRTESGRISGHDKNNGDLIEVKPVVRVERWINIIRRSTSDIVLYRYESEEEARKAKYHTFVDVLARAVPFVWEGEEP